MRVQQYVCMYVCMYVCVDKRLIDCGDYATANVTKYQVPFLNVKSCVVYIKLGVFYIKLLVFCIKSFVIYINSFRV